MRWLILSLFCLLSLPCYANGKKSESVVSFHLETNQNAGKRLTFDFEIAGKKRMFDKSAVLTHRDFIAFSTFPADDGTFGVSFLIKPVPAKRFYNLMNQARGLYLLAQVNGRFPDVVLIDEPVADQTVVIWRGVTAAEIKQYDEVLPRLEAYKKALEEKNRK